VRTLVAKAALPTLVDGDGLTALGEHAAEVTNARPADAPPPVFTPHDAEFARLTGKAPGADRLESVRSFARGANAVVLLKGSTTLVAEPGGRVLAVTAGDARLATAGTGDVLSGIIGGLLAQGVPPFEAAAAGAHLHGRAADLALPHGMVASDLIDHLPAVFAQLSEI
jgi:NAD(P)H-hydrate epimerase